MNRIRYIKVNDVYKPMRRIKNVNNIEYDVEWKVLEDGVSCSCAIYKGGSVIFSTTKQSAHKIKIAIKRKLMELGVVFEKETRDGSESDT